MSPVMELPGMRLRPWPAKTAPASTTRPPKIARPVLTGVITGLGYGLQTAVDDRLLLGVLEEGLHAVLLAKAGLLGAAEGELVVCDLQRVDPRVARLQLVHRAVGGGHVGRPDRRPETKGRVVRQA